MLIFVSTHGSLSVMKAKTSFQKILINKQSQKKALITCFFLCWNVFPNSSAFTALWVHAKYYAFSIVYFCFFYATAQCFVDNQILSRFNSISIECWSSWTSSKYFRENNLLNIFCLATASNGSQKKKEAKYRFLEKIIEGHLNNRLSSKGVYV